MRAATKRELIIVIETMMQLTMSLPRFRFLNPPKIFVLRLMGATVGRRCTFYSGVWIMPGRGLRLGDDVDLAKDVMITTAGGVRVGDRSLIGYGTRIFSSNHRVTDKGVFGQGHEHSPVNIGSDVWVGAGAIILPGVSIGNRAVVAAGAVVTRDVAEGSKVAGVPARQVEGTHQE